MGSFFEEIGKKISQTGQDVIEKTKQFTEVSKLNLKLADEEEQLERLYMNLGKLCYQLNEKEPEVIYQDVCQAIAGSLKNIKYCQKAISEMKGLKYCEACGTEVIEEASYCSHCGNHLASEAKEPAFRLCIHCGTVSTGEENDCLKCQTPL